jgi:hypothetical protein
MTILQRTLFGACGLASAGVYALLILSFAVADAQTPFNPPRTPDGHPDLQGTWSSHWLTPIERLPDAETVTLTAAEAARVQAATLARADIGNLNADGYRNEGNTMLVVQGEYRAAMIVEPPDGMLPYLPGRRPATPPGLTAGPNSSIRADGPEQRPIQERCIAGAGRGPLYYVPGHTMRTIVQTPDSFVVHSEGLNDLRVFRINAQHRPGVMRSLWGDSIASWEGDTLVVETTHFLPSDPIRITVGYTPLAIRENAKLIERFTLVSTDELLYEFTVEDPSTYFRPWKAEYSMLRTTMHQFENACHEGNYSLPNILRGARVQEQRTATAAAIRE